MKSSLSLLFSLLTLSAFAGDHPALFLEAGEAHHTEEFDGKGIPPSIALRSGSTAKVKEGVLIVENPSTNPNDRPVFQFLEVPEEFICHMRIKLDGDTYKPKNPWLDIGGGHRNHFRFTSDKVGFSSEDKELTERVIDNFRDVNMLPLGEWLDVTIEITEGKLALDINGHTETYEDENITIGEFPKISMKAVPGEKLSIDYIRVWKKQ